MERSRIELSTPTEQKNEIILYQPNDLVRPEGETVWLNRQQMSLLFGRDVKTIGKHISNAFKRRVINVSTCRKFRDNCR